MFAATQQGIHDVLAVLPKGRSWRAVPFVVRTHRSGQMLSLSIERRNQRKFCGQTVVKLSSQDCFGRASGSRVPYHDKLRSFSCR